MLRFLLYFNVWQSQLTFVIADVLYSFERGLHSAHAGSELESRTRPITFNGPHHAGCWEDGSVGKSSLFGNVKGVKQEWDAFQRGILPNVYLKPTE